MAEELEKVREEIHVRIHAAQTEHEKRVLRLALKGILVYLVNGAIHFDVRVKHYDGFSLRFNRPELQLFGEARHPHQKIPEIMQLHAEAQASIDRLNNAICALNAEEQQIKLEAEAELTRVLARFGLTRNKTSGPETYPIKRKAKQRASNKRHKQ